MLSDAEMGVYFAFLNAKVG